MTKQKKTKKTRAPKRNKKRSKLNKNKKESTHRLYGNAPFLLCASTRSTRCSTPRLKCGYKSSTKWGKLSSRSIIILDDRKVAQEPLTQMLFSMAANKIPRRNRCSTLWFTTCARLFTVSTILTRLARMLKPVAKRQNRSSNNKNIYFKTELTNTALAKWTRRYSSKTRKVKRQNKRLSKNTQHNKMMKLILNTTKSSILKQNKLSMSGVKRDQKGPKSQNRYHRSSKECFQLNIRLISPKWKELRNSRKISKLDNLAEAMSSSPTLIMFIFQGRTSPKPILTCQIRKSET